MMKTNLNDALSQCPLLPKLNSREKALIDINKMCWFLKEYPECQRVCEEGCLNYKQIKGETFVCKKYNCIVNA